ncbi:lysophospholipid acyltransferase 5-like [Styela clava]
MWILEEVANKFGVGEGAVKLLLTLYIVYIFGAIHRRFFFKTPAYVQHIYFTIIGLSLIYWNYGNGFIHSIICITAQWLIFKVIGTSTACVAISFPFQLAYLVAGYVATSTEGYDINWTMPHCVLMMRLIGLAFDIYDGHRDQEKVTPEQKTLLINDVPSLLEMFGYCYFYGGYSVGPQFPIRRFREMVNGELTDSPGRRPKSVVPALRRCISGTTILALQLACDAYFPEKMLFNKDFEESSFWWRVFVVGVRGHVLFYQYMSIWIINEGVCIMSGLGYHKVDGKVQWDAVRNVRVRKFVTAKSFQDMIDSFNINTNQWVARYVFKRLRFLGNKTVSHLSTLFFLAIWHGYHEGYFTCFFYEYIVMTVERPLRAELKDTSIYKSLIASKSTSWIPNLIGFLYVKLLFGYCVLDFSLRKWKIYAPIYRSIFYYGHCVYFSLWIILKIRASMKQKQQKESKLE